MSEYMLFCLGAGKDESSGSGYQKSYQIFNKQVEKDEWEKVKDSLPNIQLPVATWIDSDKMTAEEKKNNKIHSEIGGYLKVLEFQDAWKVWWDGAAKKDKDAILDCKYFDAEIFKGITGIDVQVEKPSLKGKTVKVEIDGQSYTAVIQ